MNFGSKIKALLKILFYIFCIIYLAILSLCSIAGIAYLLSLLFCIPVWQGAAIALVTECCCMFFISFVAIHE
jgi:Mn2+/Fe2+ NRAMP family transporter